MRAFGCHQMGSANQDSEFQVRNLKSFHRGRPAICWLLPATLKSAAMEPAGSIGLCGGSYCRRPGSVGGSLNGNRLDKASFVKFIGYGDGVSTALYVGPA